MYINSVMHTGCRYSGSCINPYSGYGVLAWVSMQNIFWVLKVSRSYIVSYIQLEDSKCSVWCYKAQCLRMLLDFFSFLQLCWPGFYVLYSTLLRLPPPFHFIGGCWDPTRAMAVRLFNHSARSHPLLARSRQLEFKVTCMDLVGTLSCMILGDSRWF